MTPFARNVDAPEPRREGPSHPMLLRQGTWIVTTRTQKGGRPVIVMQRPKYIATHSIRQHARRSATRFGMGEWKDNHARCADLSSQRLTTTTTANNWRSCGFAENTTWSAIGNTAFLQQHDSDSREPSGSREIRQRFPSGASARSE